MDKTILRSVLKDLAPNQAIKVHFRGTPEPEGFLVISTKRGRGKHGSLLALLEARNEDGVTVRTIEIGTPRNMDILSIRANGEFYGVRSEHEDPPIYPTNDAQATLMKSSLNKLVGEVGVGRRVRLESSVPAYSGTFMVTQGRLEKGKYGQVHLWLVRLASTPLPATPENCVELWSYRHSGIITAFEVLPEA